MRLLNLFDHFIENFIWLAAATVLLLVFWLFAKRTALLKKISENHPVKSAMIDLIAAPLMILLIGNFAQKVTDI
jgi:Na+/H+ antiporter NhaC